MEKLGGLEADILSLVCFYMVDTLEIQDGRIIELEEVAPI